MNVTRLKINSSKMNIVLIAVIILTAAALILTPAVLSNSAGAETLSDEKPHDFLYDYDIEGEYDVIVVGSDPEGVAAAVASARSGRDTLLICERGHPGGLMYQGALNTIDMNFNPDGELVTQGIFAEFYEELEGISFNTATALRIFRAMIRQEDNLTYLSRRRVTEPLLEGNSLVGIRTVSTSTGTRERIFAAERFIDATQDAELAAEAGVPYTRGMEDIGRSETYQAATLVFQLVDVDWNEAWRYLRDDGDPGTGGSSRSLWGFWDEMEKYESRQPDISVRGLNVGRQRGDRVLINALQITNIDPFSQESRREGWLKAHSELEYLVEHIRDNVPGFSQARLHGIAPELYVRQSRQIRGETRLDINDVREHRVFPDRVGMGTYPVDIQRTAADEPNLVLFNPAQYSIPFRALVPSRIDRLLVAGRSASYGSLAHGSARVIPVGMVAGEAAGVAADISLKMELDFRQLARDEEGIDKLQDELSSRGADLQEFHYPFAGEKSPALEGIRFVNSLGILQAGYDNQFGFEEPVRIDEFLSNLETAALRYLNLSPPEEKPGFAPGEVLDKEDYLTAENLELILDRKARKFDAPEETVQKTENLEFLSPATLDWIEGEERIERQTSYQIIKEFLRAWQEDKS